MKSGRIQGFSVLELMIAMAIVLCIAALLLPSTTPASDRLRQVKALVECRRVGDAMLTWAVLRGGAPASTIERGEIATLLFEPVTAAELTELLVPRFLNRVPENDPWGHPYAYYLDVEDPLGPDVALCVSTGRDGGPPAARYEIGPFPATDPDGDIVWADGEPARWPE